MRWQATAAQTDASKGQAALALMPKIWQDVMEATAVQLMHLRPVQDVPVREKGEFRTCHAGQVHAACLKHLS